MMVDALLQLAGSITGNTVTAQTVTGATAVISTNTVDVASGGIPSGQVRDMGQGQDLYGRFQVATAFAGLTALECQVIAADDAALTTNVTVIGSTGAIPVASLTAGARFAAFVNPRLANRGQRYVGARFVPTGTGTAGALVADLGAEVTDGAKFYNSGFAVL